MIAGTGLYPVPLGGAGVSAVDIRDVAEAAAISLTEKGHVGQTYDLVGPTVITGPSNAALWSQLMGIPIRYAGHDLKRWEAEVRGQMPSWTIFDLRTMFEGFFAYGYKATDVEVARVTELLGHTPRSYEDFAAQAASDWKRKQRCESPRGQDYFIKEGDVSFTKENHNGAT
jgi:nucleoside-diphosphate-sugar epimerase